MKQLNTKDYGIIDYEDGDLFHFPDGIFGFAGVKHFLPLCLNEEEDSTVLLLQGVEDPATAFLLINPFALDPDYSPLLTPEELQYLEVSSENDLSFYTTCVLQEDYRKNTVNLKCPVVVNPLTRRGMQVILENSPYSFRCELSHLPALSGAAQ